MRKVFDTWGKKVIAISDAVANHLRDDLGVKAGRIEVIYSGVDIGFFSKEYSAAEREEIKKSLGLGPGPIAGSIGRLSPVKGHRFFIEAMCGVIARTPSAEALIAGSGPEEASLKQFVKSLGFDDRVHFERPNTDTRKLLAVMDVFVFPSVKEGLGIGLLEALCAKKACVGTDIGGIKDIIDDGVNGILVPSGDISAMSKAITGLFNDEKKRSLIAERGQKSVRDRFSLDDMASGVIRLYEDVLKG
jgi:glycosyltransferase involved in cell wall biosynthesis